MCAQHRINAPLALDPTSITSDPVHDLPGIARQADENAARSSNPPLLLLEHRCLAYYAADHCPSTQQPSDKTPISLEAAPAARPVPAGPSHHPQQQPI